MFNIVLGFSFLIYGVSALIEVAYMIYITASNNVYLSYENVLFSTDNIHSIGFIAIIIASGTYIGRIGTENMDKKNIEE